MDIKNVISSVLPTARVSARSASATQNTQSVVRSQPSTQARQFIENVARSSSLAAVEKQGLIEAVSIADKYLSGSSQSDAYSDIASMGLYFEQTTTKEFPRWHMLTALRYYGLNRDPVESSAPSQAQAQQQVQQKLEQVAASRSVDYADIQVRQAQKPAAVKLQETAQMMGNAVRTEVKQMEMQAAEVRKVDIEV